MRFLQKSTQDEFFLPFPSSCHHISWKNIFAPYSIYNLLIYCILTWSPEKTEYEISTKKNMRIEEDITIFKKTSKLTTLPSYCVLVSKQNYKKKIHYIDYSERFLQISIRLMALYGYQVSLYNDMALYTQTSFTTLYI